MDHVSNVPTPQHAKHAILPIQQSVHPVHKDIFLSAVLEHVKPASPIANNVPQLQNATLPINSQA